MIGLFFTASLEGSRGCATTPYHFRCGHAYSVDSQFCVNRREGSSLMTYLFFYHEETKVHEEADAGKMGHLPAYACLRLKTLLQPLNQTSLAHALPRSLLF